MDQNHYLTSAETEGARGGFIVNLIDVLDFEKMIAAAQRAELRQATFLGAFGDGGAMAPPSIATRLRRVITRRRAPRGPERASGRPLRDASS